MGFFQSSRRQHAEKEVEKRRGKSATYTQPLVGDTAAQQADLDTFLAEWYSRMIFEKAAEMPRLLKLYPETMGTHYALLVPDVVSFDQFWARYFYRCSLTTVLEELSQQESDQKVIQDEISMSLPILKEKVLQMEVEKELGKTSLKDRLRIAINNNNTRKKKGVTTTAPERKEHLEETTDSDIVETIEEEDDKVDI